MARKHNAARSALVVSGGAPNATLVAGALLAFHEMDLKFDVISTSGAGALLGLGYCAPKGGNPEPVLHHFKEMGVADDLYKAFPVNFKVFNKPGNLAEMYRQALAMNPLVQKIMDWPAHDPVTQLLKDSAELALASACPTDLNTASLGLCANVPFADTIIDFDAIPELPMAFYVNAYNLSSRKMENFSKSEVTPLHLQAALSFPFLYPPTQIGESWYIEGATFDCLNFAGLLERHPDLEEIVVFDLLGADRLMRAPRDLYDAWVMSIMTPLVEIARDDLKIFVAEHLHKYPKLKEPYRVPLLENIPQEDLPDVFDWSRSNLERLFDVGYEVAAQYARNHLMHFSN